MCPEIEDIQPDRRGPLSGIGRARPEDLILFKKILDGEDTGFLARVGQEIRRDLPPEPLACCFAQLVSPFARKALTGCFENNPKDLEDDEAIRTMASLFFLAINEVADVVYQQLSTFTVSRMYRRMTDEIREQVGTQGRLIVFGDFQHVRECYVRMNGIAAYQCIRAITLWSAVRCSALAIAKLFSFDLRPAKALKWFVGEERTPDWFLASEAAVRAHRGDPARLEELRQQWGLPTFYSSRIDKRMKFHSPRFKGDHEDWRFSLALGQVATTTDQWHTAEKPVACLIDAAWRELRSRQKADEGEYVSAKKRGKTIEPMETVGDIEGAETRYIRVRDLAADAIPKILDLPAGLLERLDGIRNPEAVRRVFEMRRRGVKWEEIAESDRAKYRRAESALRATIARRAIWEAVPDVPRLSDASIGSDKEYFEGNERMLSSWALRFTDPNEGQHLAEVLREERAEWQGGN